MAKIMHLVDPKMMMTASAPVNPTHRSIATLDQEMRTMLDRHGLSDEEKVRQYNQILQRYLEYHDHLRVPSTSSPITNASKDIHDEVLQTVPKSMKRKAEAILERISHQSNMSWNERGEFVHDGQVIKGSNIVDLVNDMLRHRKTFQPRGWQDFARALRQNNVPLDLVGNRQRWDWMHRDSATSDAFSTAESIPIRRQSRPMHKTPARKRSDKKEFKWDT